MRICVFCGSSPGRVASYRAAASAFGELLARERIGLMYGVASVGLMGAVADATRAHGGEEVIGAEADERSPALAASPIRRLQLRCSPSHLSVAPDERTTTVQAQRRVLAVAASTRGA